jgi:hypothetical protein
MEGSMKRLIGWCFSGVASLVLLAACATPPASKSSVPVLTGELAGQGLLVGKFSVPGRNNLEGDELVIDGRSYRDGLRGGHVVLALPPGEYSLEKWRARSGSYIYTLPYERKFKIEAGTITNLGLVVVLTDAKEKNKFFTVSLDNSREVRRYLEANYPQLTKQMSLDRMVMAPGKYLDRQHLMALRREVALREVTAMVQNPTSRLGDKYFVFGDAGTIVSFRKKGDGFESPKIHDTGTLADIVLYARHKERLAYLSDVGELMFASAAGLKRVEIPYVVHPAKFELLDKDSVVIVDHHMCVYSSTDGGKNWRRFDGIQVWEPTPRYRITQTGGQLYIYRDMAGVPDAILVGNHP